jgi:hypothetical protein
MVVSPVLPCEYKLNTSAEFWKPEVPQDGPSMVVLTFYTHGSVIMELDDDMVVLTFYTFWILYHVNANTVNNEFIACHLRNTMCFLQMYKCLTLPLHPPNTYMLELSPTSTKCTHGADINLFCRCCFLGGCEVVLYSPMHSRPWISANPRWATSYLLWVFERDTEELNLEGKF